MLFRKIRPSTESFTRPRTKTLKLDLTINARDLIWSPSIFWEIADINYFAASALALQTLSLRAPAGFAPSRSRHHRQLPNIAGRWVLKLNPAQTMVLEKKTGVSTPEQFFAWAETHASYTTFTSAELVVGIVQKPDERVAKALLQLITSHCKALENSGSLRVMPADQLTHDFFIECYADSAAVQQRTITDIGSPMLTPDVLPVRNFTVIDIDPAAWRQSK